MDPVTATVVIVTALTSTVAGGVALNLLLKKLGMKPSDPPPALPPPEDPEEAPPESPSDPPDPNEGGDEDNDSEREASDSYEERLSRAINMLTSLIPFAKRMVFVGHRKVNERATGRREVEGEIPEAGYTIRQIQGLHEIDYLLPDEHALEEDLFFLRLAQDESLVLIPLEVQVRTEPVYEEVWESTVKVVYLLLDGSGSMVNESWRVPVWKGVAIRIIIEARANGAIMMMRTFTDRPGNLLRAETYAEYEALIEFVRNFNPAGGTNIGSALDTATNDMLAEGFDDAQLVILSDGEDNGLDAGNVRHRLDHHKVSLHAIMLGVDNHGLRSCADVYQTVTSDLRVRAPVKRVA